MWDIAFVEIFQGDAAGFDIVIGNPPYVRQEMIAPPLLDPNDFGGENSSRWKKQKKAHKEKLQRSVATAWPKFFRYKPGSDSFRKLDGKSDLYVYFYLHGLSLLNRRGSFCFITSNSWLDVGYGADLQEFLLKHSHVKLILDNEKKRSFAQADVNTIIALLAPPDDRRETGLDQTARFVMFKVPFEDILRADVFKQIETATERGVTDQWCICVCPQRQLLEEGFDTSDADDGGTASTPSIGGTRSTASVGGTASTPSIPQIGGTASTPSGSGRGGTRPSNKFSSPGPGGTGPSKGKTTRAGETAPFRAATGGTRSTASLGGTASTPSGSGRGGTRASRRRPAHPPIAEPFNRAIIVFVTVCTKDRQPLLANPQVHELLVRAWKLADHWIVGRYVIMPDHVHLFCSPGVWPPRSLRAWVRYWKSLVARGIQGFGPLGESRSTASPGPGGTGPSKEFWQRDFWHTQLRRCESYSAKWEYVRRNPVRAGLVQSPELWPYQGELTILRWHD